MHRIDRLAMALLGIPFSLQRRQVAGAISFMSAETPPTGRRNTTESSMAGYQESTPFSSGDPHPPPRLVSVKMPRHQRYSADNTKCARVCSVQSNDYHPTLRADLGLWRELGRLGR